ncbi:aldose 1-epimerase [Winogradskyella forsetii]|uniref:aldose 1-epimerase n=1 Tax=Winogradskyella forsetii TaxID=2686077 RepID=UPI0015B9DF3A|nr:aldose 1-epimerase [Winogradskyella forsetii]
MYTIDYDKNKNILEVKNTSNGVYGKIYLNDGGSLQELILNNQRLIADLNPLAYKLTYASAILFPFANRIEDGQYRFNEEVFQLEINNKEENNALHGLVFNKPFRVQKKIIKKDSAKVILQYKSNGTEVGFPFPYTIQLTYVFKQDNLDLSIEVENNGNKTFPFTIGWHPYFLSENLEDSSLDFESTKQLNIGNRNIASGLFNVDKIETLKFGTKNFDDCWMLNKPLITLKTPKYHLDIITSEPSSFLQVYTPPKPNVVAIEPTTGVSNSFNNKIGLKTLEPNDVFSINWSLKIHVN